MQITFVLPMYLTAPSGGFKVIYEYANRLQLRGHTITIVHPRTIQRKDGTLEVLKSRFWRHKLKLRRRPLIQWFPLHPAVRLLLVPYLAERFIPTGDALFATAYDTAGFVADCQINKGRKFYFIQSYETWNGDPETVRATWLLPLHKVVIARWLLSLAAEFGELQRTSYIPLGLDFNHFKLLTPIRERQLPRVAMQAHPLAIKGLSDGLRALHLARLRAPELEAVLFGTQLRPADLPDWIDYVKSPSPDNLLQLYNSSRIYLHPSWVEGWGLPAAEAMACGCALVAAANQGVHEFAEDGKTALLAPVQQPEVLADRLVCLLQDDELRQQLAEAGWRNIQQFTWEKAVTALESLLLAR